MARVIAREEAELIVRAVRERAAKHKEYATLLPSINEKRELLEKNPLAGVHMPRSQIPQEYVLKYSINNLWKLNLAGYWRMLYTVEKDKVEILAIILDILDHPSYDKKFRYRKK